MIKPGISSTLYNYIANCYQLSIQRIHVAKAKHDGQSDPYVAFGFAGAQNHEQYTINLEIFVWG